MCEVGVVGFGGPHCNVGLECQSQALVWSFTKNLKTLARCGGGGGGGA